MNTASITGIFVFERPPHFDICRQRKNTCNSFYYHNLKTRPNGSNTTEMGKQKKMRKRMIGMKKLKTNEQDKKEGMGEPGGKE